MTNIKKESKQDAKEALKWVEKNYPYFYPTTIAIGVITALGLAGAIIALFFDISTAIILGIVTSAFGWISGRILTHTLYKYIDEWYDEVYLSSQQVKNNEQ